MSESETTQRIAALEKALLKLWEEYDDRRSQFGNDYLWEKYEDAEAIEEIEAFVAKLQER
jgi:hypothetical protein